MAREDPVKACDDGSRDLYGVATWDARSPLDGIAVSVHRALRAIGRAVAWVVVVVALPLALLGLSAVGALEAPIVGGFVVLSVVPALLLAAYVWRSDVTTREPFGLLVATFALAVVFAQIAGAANGVGSALQAVPVIGPIWFFYLVVGPVEETVKWLAVRVYAFRSERFDAVIDGAVYGAVAGLGFATVENALYIASAVDAPAVGNFLAAGEGIGPQRALAGPGHVLYSAYAGYYLGLAKFNPERAGPIAVKGLLVATLLHATYNTLTLVPAAASTAFGVPRLAAFLAFVLLYDGFVGYLLYRKLARYRTAYRAARSEPEGRSIRPERTEFDP
jgi:RsiW-degrading membrane proteinase PrsW (M82 family)